MNQTLFVIALSLLAPDKQESVSAQAAVAQADHIIDSSPVASTLWSDVPRGELSALPEQYDDLDPEDKTSYDELRSVIAAANVFEMPLEVLLEVETIVAEQDRVVISGFCRLRSPEGTDFYMPVEKRNVSLARTRLAQVSATSTKLPYTKCSDVDFTRRQREARVRRIDVARQRLIKVTTQYAPLVARRRAYAASAFVVAEMPLKEAEKFDLERLAQARRARVHVAVKDYHIRPPMPEFGLPAGIGFLSGELTHIDPVFRTP